MNKKCSYCESTTNDFKLLNQTMEYSGVEIALNRQGMLRIRTYTNIDGNFDTQDVINIEYCPMCGRRFNK